MRPMSTMKSIRIKLWDCKIWQVDEIPGFGVPITRNFNYQTIVGVAGKFHKTEDAVYCNVHVQSQLDTQTLFFVPAFQRMPDQSVRLTGVAVTKTPRFLPTHQLAQRWAVCQN